MEPSYLPKQLRWVDMGRAESKGELLTCDFALRESQ